jgi:hypothetical protein
VLVELLRLMTQQHAKAVEGGAEYTLPPTLLQRIPKAFPQDSVSRGHMDKVV